jgi:hypothetical protein
MRNSQGKKCSLRINRETLRGLSKAGLGAVRGGLPPDPTYAHACTLGDNSTDSIVPTMCFNCPSYIVTDCSIYCP